MPNETFDAVNWALKQTVITPLGEVPVTKVERILLVDKVREFFNDNNIEYDTFSYDDLIPYLD